MKEEKALIIGRPQPVMNFMLSYSIACSNYVAARVALKSNLAIPGCLLAQQFAEICTKAILRVHWKELEQKHQGNSVHKREIDSESIIHNYKHRVGELLRNEKELIPDFNKINTDSELVEFLESLTDIYLYGRFGEKPVSVNTTKTVQILDKLARLLLDIHAKAINYISVPKLYIDDLMKPRFLDGNSEFRESDTTNNPIAAIMPIPGIA